MERAPVSFMKMIFYFHLSAFISGRINEFNKEICWLGIKKVVVGRIDGVFL